MYKLIKKYPGCPPLGSIFSFYKDDETYRTNVCEYDSGNQKASRTSWWYPKEEVENMPEFFGKIVEIPWQIIGDNIYKSKHVDDFIVGILLATDYIVHFIDIITGIESTMEILTFVRNYEKCSPNLIKLIRKN